jgi:hypothetical protein
MNSKQKVPSNAKNHTFYVAKYTKRLNLIHKEYHLCNIFSSRTRYGKILQAYSCGSQHVDGQWEQHQYLLLFLVSGN